MFIVFVKPLIKINILIKALKPFLKWFLNISVLHDFNKKQILPLITTARVLKVFHRGVKCTFYIFFYKKQAVAELSFIESTILFILNVLVLIKDML